MLKIKPDAMTLLAIDDDARSLALIAATLEQDGLEILTCEDPEKAVAIVRKRLPRIVICDLVMPKLNGMQVLHEIATIDPTIEVILLTGHYSAETAVEAIREGAYDYLTKPISPERLRARVDDLIAEGRRVYRAGLLDDELIETHQFRGMIGRAPAILDVFARIRRIAPHYRTVLITGATGTGKELAARALHELSPVAKGPFAVCKLRSIAGCPH
jgi:DNA-binding NtrC family response regulator